MGKLSAANSSNDDCVACSDLTLLIGEFNSTGAN